MTRAVLVNSGNILIELLREPRLLRFRKIDRRREDSITLVARSCRRQQPDARLPQLLSEPRLPGARRLRSPRMATA